MAKNALIDLLEPLFRSWVLSWLVERKDETSGSDVVAAGTHMPLKSRIWAQQKLRQMGLNTASRDYEIFPPAMVRAVRDYQVMRGLYVDGILGPQTWKALTAEKVNQVKLPGTRWFDEAQKLVGTTEISGAKHNPLIVQMFATSGHPQITDDETAWCAAFVNYCLSKAGLKGTGKLNARSFLQWGKAIEKPVKGAVAVFSRGDPNGWQGHVAFCTGRTKDGYIEVLGGNQGNSVNAAWYPTGRLLGYRWPL